MRVRAALFLSIARLIALFRLAEGRVPGTRLGWPDSPIVARLAPVRCEGRRSRGDLPSCRPWPTVRLPSKHQRHEVRAELK